MSYVSEAQQLQADTEMELTALYNKYSDYVAKGLDDDPGAAEERQIIHAYSTALNALRLKYPAWEEEVAEYKRKALNSNTR